MRNGSRVMMCLCDIKTYINIQYFFFRTEINFYLTPKSNTIFLSNPNIAISIITLSCLVVGKNSYENAFEVDIEINKSISKLKDAVNGQTQYVEMTLTMNRSQGCNRYGSVPINQDTQLRE